MTRSVMYHLDVFSSQTPRMMRWFVLKYLARSWSLMTFRKLSFWR